MQRSGTNYIETVLRKAYRVRFNNQNTHRNSPLQKHFRLYDEKSLIPEPQYLNNKCYPDFESFETDLGAHRAQAYIVMSKDPYSWFLSYSNWAKKFGWPKVEHHYVQEYTLFYKKWMQFSRQSDRIFFVRHKDFLLDEQLEFNNLEIRLRLKKSLKGSLGFRNAGVVARSSPFTDEKREFYVKEKYLQEYTKVQLDEVNSHLDTELMSFLNYDIRINVA